jgi:hypothetical protein
MCQTGLTLGGKKRSKTTITISLKSNKKARCIWASKFLGTGMKIKRLKLGNKT